METKATQGAAGCAARRMPVPVQEHTPTRDRIRELLGWHMLPAGRENDGRPCASAS